LLAKWDCEDKAHASKMEYRIKRLTKEGKLRAIMNGDVPFRFNLRSKTNL